MLLDLRSLEESSGGGSVSYVLSCNSGSYTYTGQAASLTVERKLSLAAGAYTYSGQAAGLTVDRRLALAAGSYTYAGQAASLGLERKLALAAGAYAYAGNAATLDYVPGAGAINYVISLAAGSYAYTGQDATLDYVAGAVTPPVTPSGGGKRYRWGVPYIRPQEKRKFAALEKKILKVQEQIVETRKELVFVAADAEVAPFSTKELLALQIQLMELLAKMDELRKQQEDAEDAEVAAVWAAYRRLH